ncbi:MAG: hypothetical protein V1494_00720 [Candidatus Diapherotrites archaeon]
MVVFTEEQKKLAAALSKAPKTIEELQAIAGLPFDELNRQLKHMLKLKLLTISGYPQKYALDENISKKLSERKETAERDSFVLRLKAIVEAQAIEETLLAKELAKIEKFLREEKNFTIYDVFHEKIIKEGEHYSAFLEVNLSVRDFRALMHLVFFYGPTSIEIIKPEKMEFSLEELQDGLMDATQMVQNYNEYIIGLLNKKELEEFHKKFYR